MKQTKTTLIFGVLLAIIVAVVAVVQYQSTAYKKVDEVGAVPVDSRSLSVFHDFLNFN